LKSEKLGETVDFAKSHTEKSADRHWKVNSFEPDKFHQTARTTLTVRIKSSRNDAMDQQSLTAIRPRKNTSFARIERSACMS
jgi:hypothetical protein